MGRGEEVGERGGSGGRDGEGRERREVEKNKLDTWKGDGEINGGRGRTEEREEGKRKEGGDGAGVGGEKLKGTWAKKLTKILLPTPTPFLPPLPERDVGHKVD